MTIKDFNTYGMLYFAIIASCSPFGCMNSFDLKINAKDGCRGNCYECIKEQWSRKEVKDDEV